MLSTSLCFLNVVAVFVIFQSLTINPSVDAKKEASRSDCVPSTIDYSLYHCYPSRSYVNDDDNDDDDEYFDGVMCTDSHINCPQWFEKGECERNPRYMILNCQKSCNTCIDGHAGVTQIAPDPSLRLHVMKRLTQTAKYVHSLTSRNAQWFTKCHNSDPMCTYWAVKGRCDSDKDMMKDKCSATCQLCHV